MGIPFSALPPELQRRLREEAGLKPPPRRRAAPAPRPPSGLMRVCRCRGEIFRPDGNYPDRCDCCGETWSQE